MDELYELQMLIDRDPEFQDLVDKANEYVNNIWDDEAKELLAVKNDQPCFMPLTVKEYYAKYKCILAWTILMGKVLDKIHGDEEDDERAAITIPLSTTKYIIYHHPTPWQIHVHLDSATGKIYIVENVIIKNYETTLTYRGQIKFTLEDIMLIDDPRTMTVTSKLLNSRMSVALSDPPSVAKGYKDTFLVGDFRPDRLTRIMKSCFILCASR